MDADAFDLAALPPSFYDDPYPWYDALRALDPVRTMRDGSVLLTSYDEVAAMYRNPAASSDKKIEFAPRFGRDSPLYRHHTTSLVFNDPPQHTRVRRTIVGALNQRAIARMEAGVVALVARLLDAMQARTRDGEVIDLVADYASAIPIEVIGNLLAVPHDERGPLRDWSLAILGALEPAPDAAMLARGNRAIVDFSAYLVGLIERRRRAPLDPAEDVLTRFIQGDAPGDGLEGDVLLDNCIFLLNAGHETTTNLIANGVFTLLRHPEQRRRLRAEPSLLPTAIEEMLRFESPVQLNNRRLLAPGTIGGRGFDAGTRVTMCLGAANRDAAQFPDPHRFDITRRPNRHLAFGHGDHACAGMNVARMEGRIALGALLARFETIEPGGDAVRDRRARFRGWATLPVRLA